MELQNNVFSGLLFEDIPHTKTYSLNLPRVLLYRYLKMLILYLPECKMAVLLHDPPPPPQIIHLCQQKMYLSNSRMAPKNETYDNKNRFYNYFHTYSMSDSIYLYQSMSLCSSSQLLPSSSSHSLLAFPSSLLPFHDYHWSHPLHWIYSTSYYP